MQNNYLLEGDSYFAIHKEREKIQKKLGFLEASVSEYDLTEQPLEVVLEDLDTYSFLSDKKVISVIGIENVSSDANKKDLDHLYKYLDQPNPDNLLFISSLKFNNTLKVTKELKKRMEFIEISNDPIKFIKEELKGYKIDASLITYLSEKCLGDISKIQNECDKLKTYKIDEKEILKKDIDELVVEKLGDSTDLTFSFNRSLAEKDKKSALEKYYQLLQYNIDPLGIIGLLASQLRIMYQVKVLENQGMYANDIANTLGEKNSYRVKKTMELTRYYKEGELLKLMQDMADIDLKVKTTDTDPNSLIEVFILNI
ncbi:MAG: DNA polymerase III subunit delta [Bacilli bacterium]|nr:DNA polymerase III subunit delta [Bacilli bacterium]